MAFSDKARSILTFAAYHQLSSGETVSHVVLDDGSGHKADQDGVAELESARLLTVEDKRGRLTDDGEAMLKRVVEAIRAVN